MKRMSSEEEEEAEGEMADQSWLQSRVNCHRVLGRSRKADK